MKQPNQASIGFCNWMLNISRQRLSGPQRIIVQEVYDAAVNNTPVSDQTWWNFNLFTAWRNPYYKVFRDYAVTSYPNLLTNLTAYWQMEGNSNDALGTYNGTDTDVTYGLSSGKILEGADMNLLTSSIDIGGFALLGDITVNLWVYHLSAPTPYSNVFGGADPFPGLICFPGTTQYQLFIGASYNFTASCPLNAWHMVTFRRESGTISLFVNGSQAPETYTQTASILLRYFGNSPAGGQFSGYVDEAGAWGRALSDTEIGELYNGGSGVTYPF